MKIDIRDGIPESIALLCVHAVVRGGRVSKGEHGKMYYCWATLFDTAVGTVWVMTRQYRKDDCFLVYKDRRYDEKCHASVHLHGHRRPVKSNENDNDNEKKEL